MKTRNQRTRERLHPKTNPLPERLPPDESMEVESFLRKTGVVSKARREQVAAKDLLRLRPGTWLNDEIINFYGQLIINRSEEADATDSEDSDSSPKKPLKVHYFSTFFWPTLYDKGYEKGRIAKWTKYVDIFEKDVILMAINHGNSHWTSAAINFKAKRIEAYDSLPVARPGGHKRDEVYKVCSIFCPCLSVASEHTNVGQKTLRTYLDEEHKDKKKRSFDFTGWVDYYMEVLSNPFPCLTLSNEHTGLPYSRKWLRLRGLHLSNPRVHLEGRRIRLLAREYVLLSSENDTRDRQS